MNTTMHSGNRDAINMCFHGRSLRMREIDEIEHRCCPIDNELLCRQQQTLEQGLEEERFVMS